MSLVVIDFFLLLTVSLLRLFSSVIIQLQYYIIFFTSAEVCLCACNCTCVSFEVLLFLGKAHYLFFLSLNYAYPHCLLKQFFCTSL